MNTLQKTAINSDENKKKLNFIYSPTLTPFESNSYIITL